MEILRTDNLKKTYGKGENAVHALDGVNSALAALLLSVILNPLLGTLLENMFWFFTAEQTMLPVLLSIPVFAVLGWIIPAVLYRQTERHSVVEQLRDV